MQVQQHSVIQQDSTVTHQLHQHPLTRSYEDNGWACDGRNRSGGCRSGITGFHQTKGMERWTCKGCNYDLCVKCLRDGIVSTAIPAPTQKGPFNHALHDHTLILSDRTSSWSCDGRRGQGGCRTSTSGQMITGAKRYRCTQGCDYDLCAACLQDGLIQNPSCGDSHCYQGGVMGYPPQQQQPQYPPQQQQQFGGYQSPYSPHQQQGLGFQQQQYPPQQQQQYTIYPPQQSQQQGFGLSVSVGVGTGLCVVCGGKPKEATLVHGDSGHFSTCLDCAYRLKNTGSTCPVCRQTFTLIIKTS